MWHNPASGYFMFSFPTTDCSLALAKQKCSLMSDLKNSCYQQFWNKIY